MRYKVSYRNTETGTPLENVFDTREKAQFVWETAYNQKKIDPRLYRLSLDETRWILETYVTDLDSYNGTVFG